MNISKWLCMIIACPESKKRVDAIVKCNGTKITLSHCTVCGARTSSMDKYTLCSMIISMPISGTTVTAIIENYTNGHVELNETLTALVKAGCAVEHLP